MVQRSRLSTVLSGIAGEYFVAAELSRRGYVASLTLRNTKGIDILVSNADATKSVGIQVKTTQSRTKKWVLNQKIEKDIATNLIFVFVRLNDLGIPAYYIVPRKDAADFARKHHAEYLAKPRRDGQKHKDSSMRKFFDPENKYLDRWDLLKLD